MEYCGCGAPRARAGRGGAAVGPGCDGNYFGYCNKEADTPYDKALSTVDDTERAALLTQVGHLVTEDAAWMFVVNDTAPRAMSAKVKGFEQPKSWWIDFTTVYIE